MPDSAEWMQFLRRRKEEKEKELKAEEEEDEDTTGWTLAYDSYGVQYFWHRRARRAAWEIPESAILRMMRMRKKKKLPRGSSLSRSSRVRIRRCGLGRALVLRCFLMCSLPYCCCGRARRRLRLWDMLGAPRAVFPVVVSRPEMLCIMADMDQKDSIALFSGSGMCKSGFTSDSALRAVILSLLSSGPRCSASWPFWTRRTVMQWHVRGLVCWYFFPRDVFLSLSAGPPLGLRP